jgi:ubiquinone/menaquinone biosynthesis C-methylase UbiE
MEGSYPSKLRVWEGSTAAVVPEDPLALSSRALPGPHHPSEFADRLYACECFHPLPPFREIDAGAEPYSLQWFLNIENQRFSHRGRWIPHLLEFAKHAGETLLGVGSGLGTDWLQYARHGAAVVVCCPSAAQLALIRRNFELRALPGRFVHAPPTALPLEGASIDVACISSLLHEVDQPQAVVEEIYRVLKPGGKVLAVTHARYDIDFWYRTCFFWQRWLVNPSRSAAAQVPAGEMASFTARSLRRLFSRFIEHRIHKRQLRRREVPHIWRWAPLSVLERFMGRVLVLKAFKPLSAAIPTTVAA